MNSHRYYITVMLLCACGAINVLLYVISDGDAAQRGNAFVGLRSYAGHQFGVNKSLIAEVTKASHDTNGVHSNVRKLNHAEPSFVGRKLEDTDKDKSNGEDYTRLYEFIINNVDLCGDPAKRTNSIVIVVVSNIGNFLRRNAIRNTWASTVKDLGGSVLFLTGTDDNHQHQLEKESELYADVVQVNIWDSYANLTFKSIAMLQWLTDYCSNSEFYLKADDDVYINVENVVNKCREKHQSKFFFCHVFKNAPPIRDPNSKWYVSRDHYSKKYFPTYCSGSAYVLSSAILNQLYLSSLKAKFCMLEDVFITGIAAEGMGFSHLHDGAFAFYKRPPTGCEYANALSGHQVTIDQMYVIFAQLTNHEIDCKTQRNLVLKKAEDAIAKYNKVPVNMSLIDE